MKNVAIILAAGNGNRMHSNMKKQFLLLNDKPLLYYSLKAFEESAVDEIIVVTGKEDIDYCYHNIIKPYNFRKVKKVIEGGAERYHSVFNGLMAADNCENVFIHDSARPMITKELIELILESMEHYNALIVGVPVKDTIKSVDEQEFVKDTPNREELWQIQTPQVFKYFLIKAAYQYVIDNGIQNITDDAMVLELYSGKKELVKLFKGSYENIKITTSEDMLIAETFLNKR